MLNHSILKLMLQKFISSLLFPTQNRDWYSYKGFNNFEDFKYKNFTSNSPLINSPDYYWHKFDIERHYIKSLDTHGEACLIDYVKLSHLNEEDTALNKPGHGCHIVNIYGRKQNYESNFQDIVNQAYASGATIHSFNYPGIYQSKGKIREFNDLINAALAVIKHILSKNIHPNKIILQGNSIGAAVAQKVSEIFKKEGINFRIINSSSFKSLEILLIEKYKLKVFRKLIKMILQYTGWEIENDKFQDFKIINPYSLILNRKGDNIIPLKAQLQSPHESLSNEELHTVIFGTNHENKIGYKKYLDNYNKYLTRHLTLIPKRYYNITFLGMILSNIILYSKKSNEPHFSPISNLVSVHDNSHSYFQVINNYLYISNKYLNDIEEND